MHKIESPFPKKKINPKLLVIDEMCICGASRKKHEDTFCSYGSGIYSENNCIRFTWIKSIFEEL